MTVMPVVDGSAWVRVTSVVVMSVSALEMLVTAGRTVAAYLCCR